MIDRVGGNGAMYTALKGLNEAMQNLDSKAARVAQGNPDVEKITALKLAQVNAQIQTENLKTAVETTEQILDILV